MAKRVFKTVLGAKRPNYDGPAQEYDLYGRMTHKVGGYEIRLLVCRERNPAREWRLLEETTQAAIGWACSTRKHAEAAMRIVLDGRTEEEVRSVIEAGNVV